MEKCNCEACFKQPKGDNDIWHKLFVSKIGALPKIDLKERKNFFLI